MFKITNINFRGTKGFDGTGMQATIKYMNKNVGKIWDDPWGAGPQLEMKDAGIYEIFQDWLNKNWALDFEAWVYSVLDKYEEPIPTPEQQLRKALNAKKAQLKRKYSPAALKGVHIVFTGGVTPNGIQYNAFIGKNPENRDLSKLKALLPKDTELFEVSYVFA